MSDQEFNMCILIFKYECGHDFIRIPHARPRVTPRISQQLAAKMGSTTGQPPPAALPPLVRALVCCIPAHMGHHAEPLTVVQRPWGAQIRWERLISVRSSRASRALPKRDSRAGESDRAGPCGPASFAGRSFDMSMIHF